MSTSARSLLLATMLAVPGWGAAQAPISAIEWLDQRESLAALAPPETGPGPVTGLPGAEPPVADSAGIPTVEVRPLGQINGGPIGLIPTSVTGLPITLWRGADPERLARRLERLEVGDLPAVHALLYSLMLADALPPEDEGTRPDLLLARIEMLRRLGAVDPALSLIDHVGADVHEDVLALHFDLALLAGREDEACARMAARPDMAPTYAARVYCLARLGDWNAALLTFSTMRALGEFDARTETLLELYLDPELIEQTPPLAPPVTVTPLVFRLQEAIGQPLATTALPRAYAIADLRDVSGWKAELEAVERLARTGALSETRLLQVYKERRPAASGGIWDRVAAVQAFDAAMRSGTDQKVADTVTAAWAAMREARLEVPFAKLYGARLAARELPGRAAQRTAFRVAMLSPSYESAALRMTAQGREEVFLASLARGEVDAGSAHSARARTLAAAFTPDAPRIRETREMLDQDRLGELILMAVDLLAHAEQGELTDASRAIGTLMALGLEDTARRVAMQLLILEPMRR